MGILGIRLGFHWMLLSRFELSSEVTSVRYSRVSLFALTSSCLLSSLAVSWGNKGAPGPPMGIPGGKGGAPPPAFISVGRARPPLCSKYSYSVSGYPKCPTTVRNKDGC